MGNSQSPPADPRFASATSQKELNDLEILFKSLAVQSQSNGQYISPSVFKAYFGLKGPLGQRLFELISQLRKNDKVTFQDLVIAKGTYEKGTRDEIEEFIYQLLDVTSDGIVSRSDVESVLITVLEDVFSLKLSEPGSSPHKEIVEIFLNAATFSKHIEGSVERSMSEGDFQSWSILLPSLRKHLGSLLIPPEPGRPGSQVPRLLPGENIDPSMLLLSKEYAWHIGGALSHQELEDWKLLYHSSFHGLSFNTFLGNISNNEGPTVLVIKDTAGDVYGGYASQPWERRSNFYGDMKSFLFQLHPKASIFRPTGANNNLQWCAVNFTSEDIPNGIGFGGRANHFGLFISASFDQGHTFPCTTFGSPCLSGTNRVCPEVIECWGVVPKVSDQGRNDAVKGTVLERFKEDRQMLNMVGLANSSE
ncbi:MTOR-associated protein MEAK7 isoform X2 [Tripterygium wilfordii]|uniref:MTOR-associated protein MEAK7 isoform X2 n=1 Tax=Tripterygium wilfordii TaxID=458696 RepID=UPI0018F81CA2|nr:MTOR-associated protein MEAK7 isoform X2 [Tripterygium wilfordii]